MSELLTPGPGPPPDGLAPAEAEAYARGELARFLGFTRSNRGFGLGLVIVGLSVFLWAFGPLIAPYHPNAQDFTATLAAPSGEHWFGTDENGRDVLARVLAAPRTDIYIAVVSTLLGMGIGIPLGVLASATGRVGSVVGEWILRAMDVLQAFPVFVLALALVAAFGPSATNIIVALTVLQFPVFLRLTRSAALGVRARPFIEASRLSGARSTAVLFRHVLPNSIAPPLVGASVAVAQAVLITAGLSFVGAGIRPPDAEWGAMISTGAQNMITGQWWPSVFPGLVLGIIVLGYALVGDGLRYYLDPQRRG